MTDLAPLMPEVARLLLGDPARRTARKWRYGRKGSLAIDPNQGIWHDFEAGEGGGVLDLIMRERRCDKKEALAWLRQQELLLERDSPTWRPQRPQERRSSGPTSGIGPTRERPSGGPSQAESDTPRLAKKILDASIPTNGTPATIYLDRRKTWPKKGRPLPPAVRWLPDGAVPGFTLFGRDHPNLKPPAGAILYRLMDCATGKAAPDCVHLEALTADGRQTEPRFRRTFGPLKGRAFQLGDPEKSLVLAVVEGPCDALPLARLGIPDLTVRAALSTSGFQLAVTAGTSGPVVVIGDGESPGRKAARRLVKLLDEGGRASYRVLTQTGDPDSWLRADHDKTVADAIQSLRETQTGDPGDVLARALRFALERTANYRRNDT